MIIPFDTHTHTFMSGHAYSTIEENIAACKQKGMEGFAITDHGPEMPGAPHRYYFMNMKVLPREVDGIHILRGVEVNVLDSDGNLDMPNQALKTLDVCIASFHEDCIRPMTVEDHTDAWLNVIKNPYIDIIGHSGRGPFPYDVEKVVAACKEKNKLIEINGHTLKATRYGSQCRQIAQICRDMQVNIVVSSDAHFSRLIGEVGPVMKMLKELDFPMELIVNQSYEQFKTNLLQRKPWLTGL